MHRYDMFLREEVAMNRMQESLKVFKETINNQYLDKVPIILFLNKTDLFKQKIERGVDLKQCFPEFAGKPLISFLMLNIE